MASQANTSSASIETSIKYAETPFDPTHVYAARAKFQLTTSSGAAPRTYQFLLEDFPGFKLVYAGHLTAVVEKFHVSFTRPPGVNLDVVVSLTASGWGAYSPATQKFTFDGVATTDAFDQLAIHPSSRRAIIRSTNTAVDSFDLELDFTPGLGRSLLGVLPGIHVPALTVAFAKRGDVAASTTDVYVDADIRVGGFGYK